LLGDTLIFLICGESLMPNRSPASLYACVVLGLFTGCDSTSSSQAPLPNLPTTSATTTTAVLIPLDSPFAKVKIDEDIHDVYAIIGPPTSRNSFMTGKSITPLYNYHSSDDQRTIARYKGIGTITFSSNSRHTSTKNVISIDYDPTETGYYDSTK
jgi:hypothetical protein